MGDWVAAAAVGYLLAAAVTFGVCYMVVAPWWRSMLGRTVTTIAVGVGLIAAGAVWPGGTGGVSLVGYVVTATGLAAQTVWLVRAQVLGRHQE